MDEIAGVAESAVSCEGYPIPQLLLPGDLKLVRCALCKKTLTIRHHSHCVAGCHC